jgi:hypothetical protein
MVKMVEWLNGLNSWFVDPFTVEPLNTLTTLSYRFSISGKIRCL